jgi:hypothetical protein
MMALLLEPLRRFAQAIADNFAQAMVRAQPEDQLKAPAQHLLRMAGEAFGIRVATRTEAQPGGVQARPDIGVATEGLLCGFVELKAPGLGANPSRLPGRQNQAQWEKFKNLPNLIYTDGNEWRLFRAGEEVATARVRLAGDVREDGADAVDHPSATNLERLLRNFLGWAPTVPHAPRELAYFLAPLTRLLRDEVHDAVQRPNSAVAVVAGQWRDRLFPAADDNQFADAYAQVLTYALLLARLSGAGDLTPDRAADVLDQSNGLLAQTLRLLGDPAARADIELGFGPLKRALEALDPHDFTSRSPRDPWLYFYEDFLAAYDAKLRQDYGVYYTPVEVVGCQVRLISELLAGIFGKPLSFADDGVTFLDPAVGTGTYPLTAIDHALQLVAEHRGRGAVPGRASLLARNFFGFEILVGPYAVCHLRLTQKVTAADVGGTLPDGRPRVYLADTLDSPNTLPRGLRTLMDRKLVEERERAREIKASQRVLVIFGNPPYDRQHIDPDDAETQRKGGWVRFGDDQPGAVPQTAAEAEAMERGARPILRDFLDPADPVHVKNLYNDYVYFWRWAIWKLLEQAEDDQGGILSFITASSYLAGPGFVGMREVMRRKFDDLWIINLGGDNLGARKSENVFAIRTPVAIAIGVRRGAPDPDTPALVRYAKIEGTRVEKLAALAAIRTFGEVQWLECPSDWGASFLPIGKGDYFGFPALVDLFPWQENGVQFKRTWPIAETPDVLEERLHALAAASPNERRVLFRETTARRHDGFVRDVWEGEFLFSVEQQIEENVQFVPQRFGFRSFDRHYALIDPRFADRIRPNLIKAHSPSQIYFIALLNISTGEGPTIVCSSEIPDMNSFNNRACNVLPLWRDPAATSPNITNGLLESLAATLGREVSAEDLFAYAYAMLANPSYVAQFWEEMETPGPRLAITKNADLFARAVDLGRRLIWLHTYGERMAPPDTQPGQVPQGGARCVANVPEGVDSYPEDFEYLEGERTIRVGNGGRFGPVSPAIWTFSVSGFEVVKSWLGYRMRRRSGRRSSALDDIRPESWTATMTDELLDLLWVLEHTLSMQPDLDTLLADVVAGPCFTTDELPTPGADEREPLRGARDIRQPDLLVARAPDS